MAELECLYMWEFKYLGLTNSLRIVKTPEGEFRIVFHGFGKTINQAIEKEELEKFVTAVSKGLED